MKAIKDTWPVVVSILTATGFLWLHAPTKSDFDKLESKMATKKDLAKLETDIAKLELRMAALELRMATKEDLAKLETDIAKLESRMATKEDLAKLETDIAKLESRMATKEDLAKLETTITTALNIYRDDVKQVKSELQKHTQNYAAHK